MVQISAIHKNREDAAVLVPIWFSFNSPLRPLQKLEGFWKDDSRLLQPQTQWSRVAVAVSDVLFLLEEINMSSGTCYKAIDTVNASFLFQWEKRIRGSERVLIHRDKAIIHIYIFTVGYVLSPALWTIWTSYRKLHRFTTLTVTLIGSDKQKLLPCPLCSTGWETNPQRFRDFLLIKFLGFLWTETCQEIHVINLVGPSSNSS